MNSYCSLYIVRHGETQWNVVRRIQGTTDIKLNKKGEEQAQNLQKKLGGVQMSAVFSSDLIRAHRTAEIISLERNLIIKTTQALRERSFGKHEGKIFPEMQKELSHYFDIYAKLPKNEKKTYMFDGEIESNKKLLYRFTTFLREVAVAYPEKNVLIVTHGGCIQAFLEELAWPKKGKIKRVMNTAYVVVRCDGIEFLVDSSDGIEVQDFPQ